MPRACTCCTSPHRAEIDKALAIGEGSKRAIARQYGLDSEAVRRHALNHLAPELVAANEQSREEVAKEALEHCRWLVSNARTQADRVLQRSEHLKDIVCPACGQRPNPFREWIDPLNRAVQSLGRFTGELSDDRVQAIYVELGVGGKDDLRRAVELTRIGEVSPEAAVHDALEVLKQCLPQCSQLAYHALSVVRRECEAVGMLEPHVNGGTNGSNGAGEREHEPRGGV